MARLLAWTLVAWFITGTAARGAEPPAPLPAPVAVETALPAAGDHVPQLAYDGNPETCFRTDGPVKAGDAFTMVFAKPLRLKRVRALTGQADGVGALGRGVLETSADGQAFAPAAEFKAAVAASGPRTGAVKALRVRVTADQTGPLMVREIALDADPPVPVFRYPIAVYLDASAVPDMKDWCERARALMEGWYPTLAETLASEGYSPPRRIDLVFKKGSRGIAGTAGSHIEAYDGWFKAHPDDYGALIHETVHVIQSYPKYDPVWLVEGIADYVRCWIFEPEAPRRPLDPNRIRYQDGYQVTGAFLAWLVERHDKDIVRKLNAACRRSAYKSDLFKESTGKDLDALWAEFREGLKAR
jgi:hypothetical protein